MSMSADLDKLRLVLRPFVQAVRDYVEQGRTSGLLAPAHEMYQKRTVEEVTFDETGVLNVGGISSATLRKPEWLRAMARGHDALSDAPFFKEFVDKYADEFFGNWTGVHSLLNATILAFLNESSLTVDECMDRFIDMRVAVRPNREQRLWVKGALVGVTLPPEPVCFQVGTTLFTLRRPEREDIEVEHSVYELLPIQMDCPTCIVEVDYSTREYRSNPGPVLRVVELLRILTGGSVQDLFVVSRPSNGIRIASSEMILTSTLHRVSTLEVVSISAGRAERFTRFFQRLWPLVGEEHRQDWWQDREYLGVAVDFLNEALFDKALPQRRLAFCIMGLEALFLRERGELTFRLANRVAKFMVLAGHEFPNLVDELSKAYNLRSGYIHGEVGKSSPRNKARQLLPIVLFCLRFTIAAMGAAAIDKTAMLKAIDESLVRPAAGDALAKQLARVNDIVLR
ncbi:MAG: hypothetical protein ACYCX3_01585 [Thermoleophilia bacterium]